MSDDCCEGCLEGVQRNCSFMGENNCPCCNCIIKMICGISCEKYEVFRQRKYEEMEWREPW
jgi:hypothetical protein